MSDLDKLRQERKEIIEAVYDGKIPRRVPVATSLPLELCIEYSGYPLGETQWTLENMEEIYDRACQLVISDFYPFGFARYPAHLQILNAKAFVMSSKGVIQHPEISGMEEDQYDDFIRNPYDFILEKVIPKLYPELDTDPVTRSIVLAKAVKAYYDYAETYQAIDGKMIEKYGFYVPPPGSLGGCTAPFDYLSDFNRGFRGISMDIRRCPEKIAEACEAILPLAFKNGLPPNPSKYGGTFIALHMGPYLRTKDFEKLYWPTLYKLVHALANAGQPSLLFCEQDWMRYLDYLYELPPNTILWFEYGDPQKVKDKLGKKHIISGFYPVAMLKTSSRQACIDKAKELIDILAPGGKYIFRFDKSPLLLDDINLENYTAVLEYVMEYAKYDNPGEPAAGEDKTYPKVEVSIPEFRSKYYQLWPEYKKTHPDINGALEPVIAPKMQYYEDLVMRFLYQLVL